MAGTHSLRSPRPRTAWPLAVGLTLLGCPHDDPSRPDDPGTRPPRQQQSALARARDEVAATMPAHFTHARRIERELVGGDLGGATRAASDLAEVSPSSYPADWASFVLDMRETARRTSRATDVAAVGEGVGEIAGACGSCHAALGRGPTFPADSTPPEGEGMKLHEWAAERLWEGVVGPSDEAWRLGSERLPALPECAPDLGRELDRSAVEWARERVSELSQRAPTVTDQDARAALYGEFVAACATCHGSGC